MKFGRRNKFTTDSKKDSGSSDSLNTSVDALARLKLSGNSRDNNSSVDKQISNQLQQIKTDNDNNGEQDPSSLLCGLIDSTQLAPALKTIVDRDWVDKFPDFLDKAIQSKENELLSACDDNSQELVESVGHILTARQEAESLKDQLVSLNARVLSANAELLTSIDVLCQERHVRQNILIFSHILREISNLMQSVRHAFTHIEQNNHYSALSSIYIIEEQLPKFNDFQFAQELSAILPKLITVVRDSAKAEFTLWLTEVEHRGEVLGGGTMNIAVSQIETIEKEAIQKRVLRMKSIFPGAQITLMDEVKKSSQKFGTQVSKKKTSEYFTDLSGINNTPTLSLAPLHQVLHVYTRIQELSQFQRLYSERRTAYMLRITDLDSLPTTIDELELYFKNTAGFCLVEDTVFRCGAALLPRTELEALWQRVVDKAVASIRSLIKMYSDMTIADKLVESDSKAPVSTGKGLNSPQKQYVDGVKYILQIKRLVLVFITTAEMFDFSTKSLVTVLSREMDNYVRCLHHRYTRDLSVILASERFEPFTVANEAEFGAYVLATGLSSPNEDRPHFPTTMPFSLCVPLIVRLTKAYIDNLFEFAFMLDTDVVAYFFKVVSQVLSEDVNASLRNLVITDEQDRVTVSQATQFAINSSFLAKSCDILHAFILTHIDSRANDDRVPLELGAKYSFKASQNLCTQLLSRILLKKLDDISLVNDSFNWIAQEPDQNNSDYANDIVSYLRTTLSCMVFLSPDVKRKIYKQCFEHVADNVTKSIMTQVPRITLMALYNLRQDVIFIESAASETGQFMLSLALAQLKQLCDLFLSDPADMFKKDLRMERYPAVSVGLFLKVMEKYHYVTDPSNLPEGFKLITKKEMDDLIILAKKKIDSKELI